jgi:uncharacterized protein YecA (UPF0149 family)
MSKLAFNELDKSWNRVFRTMYLAKARADDERNAWTVSCVDHDGTVIAEDCVPRSLSVEQALDAAEALCPHLCY